MSKKLEGKKVAILVADGFEQVEMTKPRDALDKEGAETKIVSIKSGKIQGVNHDEKADKFDVDLTLDDAAPDDFDALLIPGGLMNPDAMRRKRARSNLRGTSSMKANRSQRSVMGLRFSSARIFCAGGRSLPGRR